MTFWSVMILMLRLTCKACQLATQTGAQDCDIRPAWRRRCMSVNLKL
jgi:hypothetical protein